MAGDLDMGHARALLPLPAAQQILTANQIVGRQLSVREAEKIVHRQLENAATTGASAMAKPLAQKASSEATRDVARIEEQLSDAFTTTVQIKVLRRGKGEIQIRFGSLDELDRLLDRLGLTER